jgi:YVTN family beta-propeller protein
MHYQKKPMNKIFLGMTIAAILLVSLAGANQSFALQIVTDIINVGSDPFGVGVNPTTNTVYVGNSRGDTVSVINGATNEVTTTIDVGGFPFGVGVNPTTNMVYVANSDGTVSVIDGATNVVTATIIVGNSPIIVGVNPTTNMVYVGNNDDGTVSVIDGATNVVTATIIVGNSPFGVGVNPTTNMVYVGNTDDDTVSVISGATNVVTATIIVGIRTAGVGVNPTTNTVYVVNNSDATVSVIDGGTNVVTATIPDLFGNPVGVGVNPTTNTVYVTNHTNAILHVIDGATNELTQNKQLGNLVSGVGLVGVNPTTNAAYFVVSSDDIVAVIEDDTAKPVITLNGDSEITLIQGETYTEQGATVSDNDPAYSESVTIGGDTVDTGIIGDYLVTYDAPDDASGNVPDQVTRTVHVISAGQAADNLKQLVENKGLPINVGKSLTGPLKEISKILNDPNPANDGAACGKLSEFIDTLNAKESSGKLGSADATELRDEAQRIQAVLVCT